MSQRPAHKLFTLVARTAALLALACVLCSPAFAQTAGGTVISNQASATYSDGTNSYSTISNTVTVTVSLVSGLTITPDAGTSLTDPTVVAGQTLVRLQLHRHQHRQLYRSGSLRRRQCSRECAEHSHPRCYRRGQQRHLQRWRHRYHQRRALSQRSAEWQHSRAGRSQRQRQRLRGFVGHGFPRRRRHRQPDLRQPARRHFGPGSPNRISLVSQRPARSTRRHFVYRR